MDETERRLYRIETTLALLKWLVFILWVSTIMLMGVCMKTCTKCGETKPLTGFPAEATGPHQNESTT